MFVNSNTGSLVEITGSDPVSGNWKHAAFVPAPLPATMPELSSQTFLAVADARAALAALDSTASQLPNPTMLRMPALRREAQSTSALACSARVWVQPLSSRCASKIQAWGICLSSFQEMAP